MIDRPVTISLPRVDEQVAAPWRRSAPLLARAVGLRSSSSSGEPDLELGLLQPARLRPEDVSRTASDTSNSSAPLSSPFWSPPASVPGSSSSTLPGLPGSDVSLDRHKPHLSPFTTSGARRSQSEIAPPEAAGRKRLSRTSIRSQSPLPLMLSSPTTVKRPSTLRTGWVAPSPNELTPPVPAFFPQTATRTDPIPFGGSPEPLANEARVPLTLGYTSNRQSLQTLQKAQGKTDYRDYVDFEFLGSIVNPNDTLFPVTVRRYTFFASYLLLSAAIGVLQLQTGLPGNALGQLRSSELTQLIVSIVIFGLDPSQLAANLALGAVPKAHIQPPRFDSDVTGMQARVRRARTGQTALIIPCHNSGEEIAGTLIAALNHFEPRQIIVMDNANSKPTDNTEQVVRAIHPDINYRFLPVGNKTLAQKSAAEVAKHLSKSLPEEKRLRYVLSIDDDVHLPENFRAPTDKMSATTRAVMFPIKAMHKSGKNTLFTNLQGAEYLISDLAKLAEDAAGSVMAPHGAALFCETDTYIDVLNDHDLEYYGDDVQWGRLLNLKGYRMAIDARVVMDTEAPSSLIGRDLNLYKQRVRSWSMATHIDYWNFTKTLLTARTPGMTVHGFTLQKLSQVLHLTANAVDFLRFPAMAVMGQDTSFWYRLAAITAVGAVPLVGAKFKLRHRDDIELKWSTILTYPLYKTFVYSPLATLGGIRAYMIYYPGRKLRTPIPKMEAQRHPHAVWLNEDWLRGPDPEPQPVVASRMNSRTARRSRLVYSPSAYSQRTASTATTIDINLGTNVTRSFSPTSMYSEERSTPPHHLHPSSAARKYSPTYGRPDSYTYLDQFVRSPIPVIVEDDRSSSSIYSQGEESLYSRDTEGESVHRDNGPDAQPLAPFDYIEDAMSSLDASDASLSMARSLSAMAFGQAPDSVAVRRIRSK